MLHDLHEAQTYLYSSTGTGPYNDALDPIVVDEWWMLAKNDVMEMTKRGVPGVWTYGFYDGWVPNYMFFIAHTHNSIGRFYEVQSYCPGRASTTRCSPARTTTSKEWFRPNPPLDSIMWSPRNNTNIQESALLFSLNRVAKNKELFLENYWMKNKRAVDKGKNGPVVRAGSFRRTSTRVQNAAEAVNELETQGLEFHRATSAFKAGNVQVNAGDYIVRGDQPYRTIADMYFSLQNFAPANPSPYDDTGWTFPLMRNITVTEVTDKSILKQPMTMVDGGRRRRRAASRAPAARSSSRTTATTRSSRSASRTPSVKMSAAEEEFDADGHNFGAGRVHHRRTRNRAQLEPSLKSLGLSAYAVACGADGEDRTISTSRASATSTAGRARRTRAGCAPRSTRTACRTQYFGENAVAKMGDLRSKFDVILFPHGGSGVGGGGGGRGGRGGAGGERSGSLQEHEGIPVPRLSRFDRRRPRRARRRRHEGAVRVRAARRHAHHRGQHVADPAGDESHAGRDGRAGERRSSRAVRSCAA